MRVLLLQEHIDGCHVTWRSCSWSTSVLLPGKYIHITAAVWAFSGVSYATLAYSTWVERQGRWSASVLESWQCIFSIAAHGLGFALHHLASGHFKTGIILLSTPLHAYFSSVYLYVMWDSYTANKKDSTFLSLYVRWIKLKVHVTQ